MSTVRLMPPFEPDCELITDCSTRAPSASSTVNERQRLLRAIRDDDLESMYKGLWYAGRKGNISPLHHQRVIRRDLVLTERARLHLVWFGRVIYLKRMEHELLNWKFFAEVVCSDWVLHQAATGFLLSYVSLIEYPSDLDIAKASGLIETDITWRSWQAFRSSIMRCLVDRHIHIHDRYEYGELRLGRLNQIYRLKGLGLAYFTVHREYSSYFGANYYSLVALFALVSVALSAMQVMSIIDGIPMTVATLSYRFAITTLIALGGSCAGLFALYLGLYAWNWYLVFTR